MNGVNHISVKCIVIFRLVKFWCCICDLFLNFVSEAGNHYIHTQIDVGNKVELLPSRNLKFRVTKSKFSDPPSRNIATV